MNTSIKGASNMYRAKVNKNTGKINKPIIQQETAEHV